MIFGLQNFNYSVGITLFTVPIFTVWKFVDDVGLQYIHKTAVTGNLKFAINIFIYNGDNKLRSRRRM